MKTLIILILLVLLAGGAFLSRPSEQSFREYVTEQTQRSDDLVDDLLHRISAERYLDDVQFQDRYLWTTISRDGKVEYIGLFSRWFRWADGELRVSAVMR